MAAPLEVPPNSALFGHTGFVGTTLRQTLSFEHLFNSKNVNDASGRSFDLVVFAAMPAVKWLANKEPERDAATLEQLKGVLATVKARHFVLVSTIDIYQPSDSRLDEDGAASALANETLHPYGRHRAQMEQFVREAFAGHHTIVRLPALFGIHLRKNYVFDMLHGNNTGAINTNSAFQWYDVSRLGTDLAAVMRLGITEANLFPEPLPTKQLVQMVAEAGALAGGGDGSGVGQSGSWAAYDLTTKHGEALGGGPGSRYCRSAADVREDFGRFLRLWRLSRRTSVSCIAWQEADNAEALRLLRLHGVGCIEVAPTRFFDWPRVEAAHAGGSLGELVAPLVAELQAHDLQVSSLQAVLYQKPDLHVFGSDEVRAALAKHMRLVVDLAAAFKPVLRPGGPTPLVFGAPKNRQRPEGMSDEEADKSFADLFRPLAEYAHERSCVIALEPNAPQYACNYVTTSAEGRRAVEAVGHPGLRLHLDTGCMTMAGEDVAVAIESCAGLLAHVHVSEPFLAHYLEPKADHARAAAALKACGYDKVVSLELLTKSIADLRGSLEVYERTYAAMFA